MVYVVILGMGIIGKMMEKYPWGSMLRFMELKSEKIEEVYIN